MKIEIIDRVGLSLEDTMKVVYDFVKNGKPEDGSFDFGLKIHGVFGLGILISIPYPITVSQSSRRRSNKSPLIIKIEKYIPIF